MYVCVCVGVCVCVCGIGMGKKGPHTLHVLAAYQQQQHTV